MTDILAPISQGNWTAADVDALFSEVLRLRKLVSRKTHALFQASQMLRGYLSDGGLVTEKQFDWLTEEAKAIEP
jgi:hypothetical protein